VRKNPKQHRSSLDCKCSGLKQVGGQFARKTERARRAGEDGTCPVPDETARGRKPVLRDELTAVVAKQQYPRERLPLIFFDFDLD
jgi:hypothetical protein